ncbi:hypothetical protein TrRE_jg6279, partial [Triparma retinervis]
NYLAQDAVREALGIPPRERWTECSKVVDIVMVYGGDWMKTFDSHVAEVLESGVRGLIYAGEYDFICNWMGNNAWTTILEWEGGDEFGKAKNTTWVTEKGEEAGSYRSAAGLTFLKVKDAGHMVPRDQPFNSMDMRGLPTSGVKAVLAARLKEDDDASESRLQSKTEDASLYFETATRKTKKRNTTSHELAKQHAPLHKKAASIFSTPDGPRRSVRRAPVPGVKLENVRDGTINCPACGAGVCFGERGCNMEPANPQITIQKYFHFCCYCKKECPDHLPCTSCGYAKTDRVTRARHLNDKNREAKANPIAIDDDEDDKEEVEKLNPANAPKPHYRKRHNCGPSMRI